MNKAILMGRLTRDPEVKNAGDLNKIVARYSLAITRSWSNTGKEEADFIPCVAFNKAAEFAMKYLKQGMPIVVSGRLQTGSYTNKDGKKVFTMDVIVDDQEFVPGKPKPGHGSTAGPGQDDAAGINIPAAEGLPIDCD